jgi:N-acetylmuramoyl-L-alanine amidase
VAVLGNRAEVVAEADALAVAGSQKGGEAGAALTRRAADLRARIWRLEHREADGLEALELYRAAGRTKWSGACDANLDLALLQGELRTDPAGTYQAAYRLQLAEQPAACLGKAQAALRALDAFKPLPTVLTELEQAERARSGAAPAAVASVRVDESGPVVVPRLTEKLREPARITSVERYGAEDAARIVVFVTHPTTFDVGFISNADNRGPRLFVDIHRTSYTGAATHDVGGIVQRVRVGQQKDATRVVLDLAAPVYRKVFYLPEPFRLVIDVSKEPPPALGAGDAGPRSVRRVVLDPGHGGHDPGATGPTGLREKDVTLDIAHRAGPLLARELGIATLLTRDSDVYVALDERTARANAFGADVFVSIHCNASENGLGQGVMTFVLDVSKDAVAAQIAARENAASPAAAAELANALSRAIDAATLERSAQFATLLQRASMASLAPGYPGTSDQGIKRAGFYVLAGARMPAVLFETSFISNPVGELRLNTGDYRQKMADSIVNAVRAYRDGR